jgi:hypothetical protein
MITTETLLTAVTHGTPSDNYDGSSQDWFSDAVKAADYYRGRGGVQTMGFSVAEFSGTITIEATLDSDPASANWFKAITYGNASIVTTQTISEAVTGNFTWLRARVEQFDAGTINSVTVTY